MPNFPVVDGHNDLPYALRAEAAYSVAPLAGDPRFHTDLPRLVAGGVAAQFWSVWVPSSISEPEAVAATLEQIDAVHRMVAAHPDRLRLATTSNDVASSLAGGPIASLLGIEGGHSIARSLGVLRMMYALGVRYMTLTHNDDLAWATSATGERERATADTAGPPGARSRTGLSPEGRAVVEEMNQLGMMVDLSHTNEATQLQAMELSAAPPYYSHSSVQGVTAHPRNVTDTALEAIRARDGVLSLTFVPAFVSAAQGRWREARAEERLRLGYGEEPVGGYFFPRAPRPGETTADLLTENAAAQRAFEAAHADPALAGGLAAWEEAHPMPEATLDDVVAHIEYAREWLGSGGIALGGDYDGVASLPRGLEDVARYQRLLEALAQRGFSREDLRGLAGANALRVLRGTEDAAEAP